MSNPARPGSSGTDNGTGPVPGTHQEASAEAAAPRSVQAEATEAERITAEEDAREEAAPPPPFPANPPLVSGNKVSGLTLVLAAGVVILGCTALYLGLQNPPTDPALLARLDTLEQNSAAASRSSDLPLIRQLEGRVNALETSSRREFGPLSASVRVLADRISALEHRPLQRDEELMSSVAALGKRADETAAQQQHIADDAGAARDRLQAALSVLETRIVKLETGQQDTDQAIDAARGRLNELAGEAGKVTAVADRAGKLARIQAASSALNRGEPLGDIPGAPPALARFAAEAPPTLSALTLEFEPVARQALHVSRPDTSSLSFWQAVRQRAESLVTVRRGDQVLVGDPAAGVIARAKKALDAGDLAGAVKALDDLKGAPAEAASAWKARAQALLDAQAALSDLAAHA